MTLCSLILIALFYLFIYDYFLIFRNIRCSRFFVFSPPSAAISTFSIETWFILSESGIYFIGFCHCTISRKYVHGKVLSCKYVCMYICFAFVCMCVSMYMWDKNTFISQPLTDPTSQDGFQHSRCVTSFSFSQREISLIMCNVFKYMVDPSIHIN